MITRKFVFFTEVVQIIISSNQFLKLAFHTYENQISDIKYPDASDMQYMRVTYK